MNTDDFKLLYAAEMAAFPALCNLPVFYSYTVVC